VILVLLYHHVNTLKYSNNLQMFQSHLRLIAGNYPVALPGDLLPPGKMAISLTFDDAYYDFYHYVFPLLREYKVKALLAVPVKYIVEDTDVDAATRLHVPHDDAMNEGVYRERVPFCTWAELSQMVQSGYVEVASHSYSHSDLTGGSADLPREIAESKAILERRLSREIATFVHPFGRVNRKTHRMVQQHYRFSIRIGSALNMDWHNAHGMIYRVDADCLPDPGYPLKRVNLVKYFLKYLSNTVRGR
jgi:peptidoglycan/xylan/chitin deacetylase (PgdA/CDA1 family)